MDANKDVLDAMDNFEDAAKLVGQEEAKGENHTPWGIQDIRKLEAARWFLVEMIKRQLDSIKEVKMCEDNSYAERLLDDANEARMNGYEDLANTYMELLEQELDRQAQDE